MHIRSLTGGRNPNNRPTSVVDAKRLAEWLLAQPHQLGNTKLALLKLAAEEPETWHVDPRAADTLRVMQRFERLAAQVDAPRAPVAAPKRARATPRKPATRTVAPTRFALGDLLKLWFAVAVVVIAILMFRGIGNQPCTSVVGCIAPPLYLAFKPLLVLGAIAAIGVGAIGTLAWLVRRLSR